MNILVDTDWIIDGLAGNARALRSLAVLGPSGLAISAVTLGEIFEGAYSHANPDQQLAKYRTFLEGYALLPITAEVASAIAPIRSGLRSRGLLIPDLDLLIAATAIAHDLPLLTRNTRHFERIPGLRFFESGGPG